jgi:hypothetical protein
MIETIRKMNASNPDYEELNLWLTALAEITNYQCHFNIKDVPLEERLKAIDEIKYQLQQLFQGGCIADWLASQKFIKDFNYDNNPELFDITPP